MQSFFTITLWYNQTLRNNKNNNIFNNHKRNTQNLITEKNKINNRKTTEYLNHGFFAFSWIVSTIWEHITISKSLCSWTKASTNCSLYEVKLSTTESKKVESKDETSKVDKSIEAEVVVETSKASESTKYDSNFSARLE